MSVTSVENISDLQGLTGPFNPGDVVVVEGYHNPGDGGGGSFYFEGVGAAPPSAQIIAIAFVGSIATITTQAAHGLVPRHQVAIAGSTLLPAQSFRLVGTWVVSEVPSATTLTVDTGASFPSGAQPARGLIGDGGTTIPVESRFLARWLRTLDTGWINVKWFGAYGDNSNDDTAAIQTALDFVPPPVMNAVPGKSIAVFMPPGAYRVTAPTNGPALAIVQPILLQGAGCTRDSGTQINSSGHAPTAGGSCSLLIEGLNGAAAYSRVDGIFFNCPTGLPRPGPHRGPREWRCSGQPGGRQLLAVWGRVLVREDGNGCERQRHWRHPISRAGRKRFQWADE